jgi:hypothetical protein
MKVKCKSCHYSYVKYGQIYEAKLIKDSIQLGSIADRYRINNIQHLYDPYDFEIVREKLSKNIKTI